MGVSFGLSRVGLEVYTTAEKDEEDKKKKEESSSESTSDTTSEQTSDSMSVDTEQNFTLETGEIKQIDYIGEFYSDNYEQDYTDISSNASISVPISYLKYFYKGRRVCLKKGIQNTSKYRWKDMSSAILGFITEITYQKDKVDVRINGMDKLLDVEKQFTFKQTKRSVIVKKIIEASGLKADVNVKGLDDDVTDFTNVSSSGSSEGTAQSSGSASIDEAVKNAIAGKTSDLEKAKAIDAAFKSHVYYQKYWDCEYSDLDEAWKDAHLNCADGANVLCAMFIAGGFKAVILHVTDHYIVRVTVGGKDYLTDSSGAEGAHNQRPFGDVFTYDGFTDGTEVGTKISMQ